MYALQSIHSLIPQNVIFTSNATMQLSFTGTINSNYVSNVVGNYTFYAFGTSNQSMNISNISGIVPIYICAVGGGGGGGIGNSTKDSNCNGANGGGMVTGIFYARSNDTLSITIGNGGNASISSTNGFASSPPTAGGNTTVTSINGLNIIAYGGNSGTYNFSISGNAVGTSGNVVLNGGIGSGTSTNLYLATYYNGGIGGNSQGTTNNYNNTGGTGNYCLLPPFVNTNTYYLPLGSGGTGGTNGNIPSNSAPFAGGAGSGYVFNSVNYNGNVNLTYNKAILPTVIGNTNATNGFGNTLSHNAGVSASNSGAGGSSSQAQGSAGKGGSGIFIVAIPTINLVWLIWLIW